MEKTSLPLNVTQQMVDDAKTKHGSDKIVGADLFIDNESVESSLGVLVLKPTSRVRNEYLKWVDKNPNKAEEILIKACILNDTEKVIADDKLRVAAVDAIVQLLPSGKAVIKNV